MKVLIVVAAYPRYKGDVIVPWLVELIKKMQARGVDVSVFTSSFNALGNQVIDGVQVYRFRYFLKKFERLTHEETAIDRIRRGYLYMILPFFYMLFGSIAIIRLVKKTKFDIIHIHWPFPHIIFGILGKYIGCMRLFSSFYGAEIRWLKRKFAFLVKVFSIVINKSDVITAISNHTAKELRGIVFKKIEVIPLSAAISKIKGNGTDDKEILFVGRLVERKGIHYLIEAFNILHEEIPHRLVIVGDGPERDELKNLVCRLELQSRVLFTGKISDDDLQKYYRRSSFFVLPAIYDRKGDTEGLGVVLLEAMSYSKPVIASKVGGITDIVINNLNGLLVQPANPQDLAKAIRLLAKDNSVRKKLGEGAKKTVDEKFNWHTITNRILSLYEKNAK